MRRYTPSRTANPLPAFLALSPCPLAPLVMVRVPVPERYAIHKFIVSQLRGTVSGKAAKDLQQAATLIEVVVERFPGAIEDALSTVPKSARRYLRPAMTALKRHLPASAEAAWGALQS